MWKQGHGIFRTPNTGYDVNPTAFGKWKFFSLVRFYHSDADRHQNQSAQIDIKHCTPANRQIVSLSPTVRWWLCDVGFEIWAKALQSATLPRAWGRHRSVWGSDCDGERHLWAMSYVYFMMCVVSLHSIFMPLTSTLACHYSIGNTIHHIIIVYRVSFHV